MEGERGHESAISGVVGEMLMIAIVLILVSIFSASLPSYLPSERSPTVTILLGNDTAGNVTLWHKGGDWLREDSLKIIISNRTHQLSFRSGDHQFVPVPDTQTFDLGGNITVITGHRFSGDETVVLSTDRAVIFSGTVTVEGTS